MKKAIFLMCLLLPVLVFAATYSPREITGAKYAMVYLDPDYKIADGDTTRYSLTSVVDTAGVYGASDTLAYCYWVNQGMGQSITFQESWNGAAGSAAYVIEVQAVNLAGALVYGSFPIKSWIEISGTGQANQKEVNTVTTNTTVVSYSVPIQIWSGHGQFFRIMIYSTAAHTGNLMIRPILNRIR